MSNMLQLQWQNIWIVAIIKPQPVWKWFSESGTAFHECRIYLDTSQSHWLFSVGMNQQRFFLSYISNTFLGHTNKMYDVISRPQGPLKYLTIKFPFEEARTYNCLNSQDLRLSPQKDRSTRTHKHTQRMASGTQLNQQTEMNPHSIPHGPLQTHLNTHAEYWGPLKTQGN